MKIVLAAHVTPQKVTAQLKFLARKSRAQDEWYFKPGHPKAPKPVAELLPENVLRFYKQTLSETEVEKIHERFAELGTIEHE